VGKDLTREGVARVRKPPFGESFGLGLHGSLPSIDPDGVVAELDAVEALRGTGASGRRSADDASRKGVPLLVVLPPRRRGHRLVALLSRYHRALARMARVIPMANQNSIFWNPSSRA